MNRTIIGAFGALLLVAVGLFWWQGRALDPVAAPPPSAETMSAEPEALPSADVAELQGPALPTAAKMDDEQRRFARYDINRDLIITRNEMLSTRVAAFRKLDVDGNNLLTFEEWAVTTVNRFEGADADQNDRLTQAEFATTAPKRKPKKKPSCSC
ncbi:hypothetical protein [Croceicoccus naphthovorans]|uniref:Uncharacterized protein n=1 Tax=Croceicoccus naphthovorans TaxID=1348774 RepID=A0A0G3XFL6_9SPHN|nr:hypothetical protein [Croceicoccus naphthovorans]AKM09992.1 hypothetical protein AB433_08400 [Croceicoccus naphthovorans]MBB3991135.1 hypothetical protein [Croceicoccus naphthovorans]